MTLSEVLGKLLNIRPEIIPNSWDELQNFLDESLNLKLLRCQMEDEKDLYILKDSLYIVKKIDDSFEILYGMPEDSVSIEEYLLFFVRNPNFVLQPG